MNEDHQHLHHETVYLCLRQRISPLGTARLHTLASRLLEHEGGDSDTGLSRRSTASAASYARLAVVIEQGGFSAILEYSLKMTQV